MSKELDVERNKDIFWFIENLELQTFDSYLSTLDKFLAREIQLYIDEVEKANQLTLCVVDGDEYMDIDDLALANHEHSLFMYENFRNLFLKSFITNLYTFLESGLAKRCRNVERAYAYPLSVKDLSGNGISQYMTYLIKLHRINYSLEKSTEWAQIQHFRRLRNCIVHNGGTLDESTDQVRQLQDYIKKENTLSIENNNNEIIVSKEFCEKSLLMVKRFLYAVDKAIIAAKTTL